MADDISPSTDPPADQDIPDGAVVVGLDGSQPSMAALRWAAQEAAFLSKPLHVLAAQEQLPGVLASEGQLAWSQYEALQHRDCAQLLGRARDEAARVAPGVAVTTSTPWGRPAQHLVEASGRASVIVVGHRGLGWLAAAVLGTVSLQVATHASGPVVVVREWTEESAATTAQRPRRAVVGVDGSDDSRAAIRFALEHVGPQGRVELLMTWWLEVVDGMVVTTPGSPQWEQVTAQHEAILRDALQGTIGTPEDPRVTLRVERGHAAEALIAAAGPAGQGDLTVVGTRGRGGFRGLVLGSVSQQVLTAATGPVAVLRSR